MSVGDVAAVLVLAALVVVAVWTLNRGSIRQNRLAQRTRERQIRRLGRGGPASGDDPPRGDDAGRRP